MLSRERCALLKSGTIIGQMDVLNIHNVICLLNTKSPIGRLQQLESQAICHHQQFLQLLSRLLFCLFRAMAGAITPIENTITRSDALNIISEPIFIFRLFILLIFFLFRYKSTVKLRNRKEKSNKIRIEGFL